mmetsp:Transcript_5960/g.7891  ORF Transcript_5960/g.7891 Transcript_5960/m.7891 type:complete len:90 (-) Transcript_5960:32-301(-)
MVKQKKINWKDTNLALIGSDLDRKIKQAAAEGETQWTDVGNIVQLKVWRIENFIVKPWPESKYGQVSIYKGPPHDLPWHKHPFYFLATS